MSNADMDFFLKNLTLDELESARERISPLVNEKRRADIIWLCSLCYELGRSDAKRG